MARSRRALLFALAFASDSHAQSRGSGGPPGSAPRVPESPFAVAGATPSEAPTLRGRVGLERASTWMRSPEPDDRLRGIERAAQVHTLEGLALLERAASVGPTGNADPRAPLDGVARRDPRALLAVVHGLSSWVDSDRGRAALGSIVGAPPLTFALFATPRSDPTGDDGQGAARVQLARQEAAIALARSGHTLAVEVLIALARSGGPGQEAALLALTLYPPAAAVLGGVTLTTPATASLAAAVGDLRSFDALEGALRASDPALRASAIVALGEAGDSRVVEAARSAVHDPNPRVRLAAGEALVRLDAPEAAGAVAELAGEDATALGGLRLAQISQGDAVIKAAAAVALVSADPDRRAAAVAALGRQVGEPAVAVLVTLVGDPSLQGDAACALGRSPSPGAMAAIEALSRERPPRLAARAYLVRRLVRGERSARLDDLFAKLADSADARDRAVGVAALITTRERSVASGLADGDARVRRAAAMASLATWDGSVRDALLGRMTVEVDAATRQVLGIGLLDGDPDARVPTEDLVERARTGGPDAPLAALALARRATADGPLVQPVDALLASRDPLVRAHVARGLGLGVSPFGIGRLTKAYRFETDVQARRAIIAALAARDSSDARAAREGRPDSPPARTETLVLAAQLDPDPMIRRAAERGLSRRGPSQAGAGTEVAWLRLLAGPGAARPEGMTAVLVSSEGLALPIAFDDDGFALVPGLAPGQATLRLAPRVPAYDREAP